MPRRTSSSPNDDGSTGACRPCRSRSISSGRVASVFVNNNGNVTFDGPLSHVHAVPAHDRRPAVIAPFFADVDTRGPASSVVTWGTTTWRRPGLLRVWGDFGVGYYSARTDKLNDFQLLLVDRSDIGPGDFDIVLNYDRLEWETGEASGGVDGLGGSSARAGFSNGDPASRSSCPARR